MSNQTNQSISHFNTIAKDYDYWKNKNKRYYDKLKSIIEQLIPKDKSTLDFGCGTGILLKSIEVDLKVGYDPSIEMLQIAKKKYPEIEFTSELPQKKFEYIYSVDVIEHVGDLKLYLSQIKDLLAENGIIILIFANPYWEPILLLLEFLKMKMPEGKHHRFLNRTVKKELKNLGLKCHWIKYKMPSIKKIGLIEVWKITNNDL